MAKSKKFGAFTGVFTPSVLTILGVIMYLRLGWVVGQAGLFWTIIIVLIAHVISVSTGLSVSSISTDKKVQAGGLYYILSRSLGLPIGGAIGITLFVGTALSIALYAIGFSESFLDFIGMASGHQINENALTAIKQSITAPMLKTLQVGSIDDILVPLKNSDALQAVFHNKEAFISALKLVLKEQVAEQQFSTIQGVILANSRAVTVNDLRLAGTATVIFVTTIAFISTSFALKTQFFIMAAIALSLVAIFMGSREFAPKTPTLAPSPGASLGVIFGVFFPAVTGFTAGVAMSGDLKNPKRTIPVGTMASIVVGLVVYIVLSIFLAYTIDPHILRNNSNILKEIAFISPAFVLAGIWGATLSSALGGILGAPRILQAMSVDKITPKLFGKGVGKNNEPRNALLLTFVIAEAGVLIGELNAIAQVVSMFYLAAYGFINLSCFLESWASPDFRPTFKIPKFVSLTGFGFTLFVMIALDLTSMVVAFVIIGAIFLYLVRKQISLGFGDVWEGVWASVVRRGLYNIVSKETKQRNWRPNIVMFSGGEEARPHLVQFGKTLVGRLGFLSDFHLIERKSSEVVFSKPQQFVQDNGVLATGSFMGFFTRKLDCIDLYDGMENIAKTYGFSGLDPNTILMGWGRQAKDPTKFISFVHNLVKLDYNILLMQYNQAHGFGKQEAIDIWWRGKSFNVNLTLTLLKFIQSSDDWRKAKIRCLIVSEDNLNQNRIYKNITLMLEEMRIDAEVKVISNEVQQRPYQEIINAESTNTDLVILGLPEIKSKMDFEFYENTNQLISQIDKTVVMAKSSSYFETASNNLLELTNESDALPKQEADIAEYRIPELVLPQKEELANIITQLHEDLRNVLLDYSHQYINPNYAIDKKLTQALRKLIKQSFDQLKAQVDKIGDVGEDRQVLDVHLHFMQQSGELINNFIENQLAEKYDNLVEGSEWLYKQITQVIAQNPVTITIKYDQAYFEKNETNKEKIRNLNWQNRLKYRFSKKPLSYTFKHHKVLQFYVQTMGQKTFSELYRDFDRSNIAYNTRIQELLRKTAHSFDLIEKELNLLKADRDQPEATDIAAHATKLTEKIDEEYNQLKNFILDITNGQREKVYKYNHILLYETHREIQEISQNFDALETNQLLRKGRKEFKKARKLRASIEELPDLWKHNQALVTKTTLIEARLLSFRKQLAGLLNGLENDLNRLIGKNINKPLNVLERFIDNFDINDEAQYKTWIVRTQYAVNMEGYFKQSVDKFLSKLKDLMASYSETIDMIHEESLSSLETEELEELESMSVSVNRLLDYFVQFNLIEPLVDYTNDLPRKFQRASNMANEVKRMLSFHINQLQNATDVKQKEIKVQVKALLAEEKQQIDKERKEIENIQQQVSTSMADMFRNTVVKLSPYVISRSADNAEQYIRSRENKTRLSRVGGVSLLRVQSRIKNSITRLWYRRSEGILAAQQLQSTNKKEDSKVERVLNLVEAISPKPEVIEALPVYYHQLFTHKNTFGDDFWVGRKSELEQAQKAINRFKDGFGGALMITGDYNSGRTFLSQHIAEQYFSKRFVHYIAPPAYGSIDVTDFKRAFENGVGIEGEYPEIFAELSLNTVLVFNDLELWWERSPNGWQVLEMLLDLLDTYSEQCFFILNINQYSLRFINMVKKIENYFLTTINCAPFNAEALKDIILFRHRSSPITFEWKGIAEKDMTEWKYARLMSKYFDYSQGNVGIALQVWISHIEKVDGEVLVIREPSKPNTEILGQLPEDWLIWIVQFILHKHLTLDRLLRITMEDERVVYNRVKVLKRAGIIKETNNNVLKINPYLEHHLIQELTKTGVI
ncbi:amino acid permease [uncultured Microscilla sp.]|uniref:amino acid permease n=1 Tax=uncultured Microscilla sp. TaxID=432653 RepID=UPI00261C4EB6|nr:amino acid permease [uncultured Microscilla sp.]